MDKESRERLLTKDEQLRIGTAIAQLRKEHPENSAAYDAIMFLFLTGCRKGEAFRLKWTDIDFERQTLRFAQTKTDPRTQHMSEVLVGFLKAINSSDYSPYVFPGRRPNLPLTDIKRSWSRIQRMAGLQGVRLHDIRHTVLSDIAADMDIQTAKIVAGHRSIQSTMRYVHGRSESVRIALQKVANERSTLLMPNDNQGK